MNISVVLTPHVGEHTDRSDYYVKFSRYGQFITQNVSRFYEQYKFSFMHFCFIFSVAQRNRSLLDPKAWLFLFLLLCYVA